MTQCLTAESLQDMARRQQPVNQHNAIAFFTVVKMFPCSTCNE